MARLVDTILRALLTAGHSLLRRRRRRRPGVHAVALTPERRIVLVRLRYARGWRLPGGGLEAGEDLRTAVLRELAEEIGMTSHGTVRAALTEPDPVLIVEDVRYRPRRWSWEVEEVMEAASDRLPDDLSPVAAEWLEAVRDKL
jgi:ADP-ribose pyrophosphatase YjhB (NUDIX family)